MAIVTIRTKPFSYANFVHLDIPNLPGQHDVSAAIDVGQAFPTDEDAARYWDDAKAGWMENVRQRRLQLGKKESQP